MPKHILVIRLSAMGDVAMTVPVLRAFTEQHPDVKITVLTKGFFTPFFQDIKNVSVFKADIKGKHKGILGLYRLSKELKARKIDAVADLHNVLRSNILKLFFFGKTFAQIDKGRQEKKALVSGQSVSQLKSTHQRYIDVFESLGYPVAISNPNFPPPSKLKDSILKITGTKESEWIGIAPFAAHKSKMYPLDKMVDVIEGLPSESKIFLFGGGDKEIQFLKPLEAAYKNVTNLAGELDLTEELDVISHLDVMVSMDSGNGHLAAMLGKNVITIWGVTHPFAGFVPFHQPMENQLIADRERYPKIPTSIYGNTFPEGYEHAAGSILPDIIIDKIKTFL